MTLDYRHSLAMLSRVVAALLGGYVLSALAASALSLILPGARAEVVLAMSMLSFALYTVAVLWVFAARNAWRAWVGLLTAAIPCALLIWGLR